MVCVSLQWVSSTWRRNRWRPIESALAALGSIAEDVLEFCEDEMGASHSKAIQIERLLTDVIPSLLISSRELTVLPRCNYMLIVVSTETPFLQGRGFVFASQYAKILPEQLAGQYLSAAIEVMEQSEAGIPIKLSAVKAINKWVTCMWTLHYCSLLYVVSVRSSTTIRFLLAMQSASLRIWALSF